MFPVKFSLLNILPFKLLAFSVENPLGGHQHQCLGSRVQGAVVGLLLPEQAAVQSCPSHCLGSS